MEKNWIKEGLFRLKWFLTPEYGREELLRKENRAEGADERGNDAFSDCREPKSIELTGEQDPVRAAVTLERIRGRRFMQPRRALPREGDKYWKKAAFRTLAKNCETGSAGAMEELAAFFEAKQKEDPETAFYGLAANFWRFRAWERGSKKAGAWLEAGERAASVALPDGKPQGHGVRPLPERPGLSVL